MGKRVDSVPTPLGAQGPNFNFCEKSKSVGAHSHHGSSETISTGDKTIEPVPKVYCTDCLTLYDTVLKLMDHCHKCHIPREDRPIERGTTHCVVSSVFHTPNKESFPPKDSACGNGANVSYVCNHPNKSGRVGAKLWAKKHSTSKVSNSPPPFISPQPSLFSPTWLREGRIWANSVSPSTPPHGPSNGQS